MCIGVPVKPSKVKFDQSHLEAGAMGVADIVFFVLTAVAPVA